MLQGPNHFDIVIPALNEFWAGTPASYPCEPLVEGSMFFMFIHFVRERGSCWRGGGGVNSARAGGDGHGRGLYAIEARVRAEARWPGLYVQG